MTPRIIGSKKSRATQAVERFFKERGLEYQMLELSQTPLSAGELERVAGQCGGYESLIDTESASYRKRGMQYMEFDPREELESDSSLLRIPILRTDKGVAVQPGNQDLLRLTQQ